MRKPFLNFKQYILGHKIVVAIIALGVILVLAAGTITYFYFFHKVTADITRVNSPVALKPKPQATASVSKSAVKKAIKESPPQQSTSGGVSTVENSDGSKTTIVSEGPTDSSNTSAAASAGASGSSPISIHYIDETGQNSSLGNQLMSYISNNLLYASEVPALYAIILENAGDTGWTGLYSGSYTQEPDGRISSSWGYITLNTYYYKDSPYFIDYMKLVLSHEYGHHYTLYHKWMAWQSPFGERFPDSYYSVRPLTKSGTAPDYSLGWANCDAEIIAEDYSYLYSGYGYHAMAGTYGYPSAGTRTWLKSEPSGSSASTPEAPAQSAVAASVVPVASASPQASSSPSPVAQDTQNPSVTITAPPDNPHVWASGNLAVGASATDNVAVSKIEFYVNNQLAATQNGSSISRTWMQNGTPAGSYTLKAKAYDTSGNIAETSITINKTF